MATYVTDDAVCLRVTDFSETSQIAALLTRSHGVVPLIAKGSKRQTRKGMSGTVSGPLDLLSRGQVVFIPSKGAAELGTLAAWELTDPRNDLRKALPALYGGMVLNELTLMLLHPHDPHPELFEELDAALALLPTEHRARAVVSYVKALLVAAGYQPQLGTCTSCGGAIASDGALRYSPRAGGVVCGRCPTTGTYLSTQGRIVIALDRLPTPAALRAAPPERAADPAALLQALQLLLAHVEAIVDKPVKTRSLLPVIFKA